MSITLALRIDPEFKDKIPALTEDEYKQLEENILESGEVYTPIITWNGIIVDGHNRWKIIREHPDRNIIYRTKEMTFADKWEAFDWMYANQLGRRNLTDEQRSYLIGKMYEARKHAIGNPNERNEHGKFQCTQNGNIGKRVSEQIADELGVAKNTVIRSERFSKGIDAIRDVSPETASDILSGKKKEIRKQTIQEIGSAKPDERAPLINEVIAPVTKKRGRPPKPREDKPKEKPFPKKINQHTKRGQQEILGIRESIRDLEEGICTETTSDIFSQNLRCDIGDWIVLLQDVLDEKASYVNTETEAQIKATIRELTKLREVLANA